METKRITFKACQRGEHKACRKEIVKENPDDVSAPRYRLKCDCQCHQPKSTVPIEYKLYMKECRENHHKQCPGQFRVKELNQSYFCKCRCHTEN